MTPLTQKQVASREKTLRAALLLSLWAPLTTGIAVLLSRSTTQLADFIRRTVEMLALAVSWGVFRYLEQRREPAGVQRTRLEHIANVSVAAALACSGMVMLVIALTRWRTYSPGGNVYPGLTIAGLAFVVHTWFWLRYARLTRERYNPIIAAQLQLYRTKTYVDLCVIVALAAVAIAPTHPSTRYVDVIGSMVVALYLIWSGLRTARGGTADLVH